MLQQFTGDLPLPNTTASHISIDDIAINDTQPLFRRRRSERNRDSSAADDATGIRNDEWIRLMRNMLWKNRRRRKTEFGFETRKSSTSKDSISRRKKSDSSRGRHSRQAHSEVEDEDYAEENNVDAEMLNVPVNEFIRSYMRTVAKYWPMFQQATTVTQHHVFQSILTRTTLATNLNRDILTSAGVPFKEFVVTCR